MNYFSYLTSKCWRFTSTFNISGNFLIWLKDNMSFVIDTGNGPMVVSSRSLLSSSIVVISFKVDKFGRRCRLHLLILSVFKRSSRRICAGSDFKGLHVRSSKVIFSANSGALSEPHTGEFDFTSCFSKFRIPVLVAVSNFCWIKSREDEFPILSSCFFCMPMLGCWSYQLAVLCPELCTNDAESHAWMSISGKVQLSSAQLGLDRQSRAAVAA